VVGSASSARTASAAGRACHAFEAIDSGAFVGMSISRSLLQVRGIVLGRPRRLRDDRLGRGIPRRASPSPWPLCHLADVSAPRGKGKGSSHMPAMNAAELKAVTLITAHGQGYDDRGPRNGHRARRPVRSGTARCPRWYGHPVGQPAKWLSLAPLGLRPVRLQRRRTPSQCEARRRRVIGGRSRPDSGSGGAPPG
jgi:hypothetical protein